jgi:hypothetical protein
MLQKDATGLASAGILNLYNVFGVLRAVNMYTRTYSPAQQNYDTYDRVPLAIVVTAHSNTKVLRNDSGKIRLVWKELYYGRAERLGDVENTATGWWYNVSMIRSGMRCSDVGQCSVVVFMKCYVDGV